MKPVHFRTAAAFRRWLGKHHADAPEIWVRFYKKASGRGGMTYPESVLEALCFGWIDGLMRSEGADSYVQRFTPRKPGSNWSNINVAHIERLKAAGRMHPAGLAAFALRDPRKTGVYSFEKPRPKSGPHFPRAFLARFRARPKAWAFYSAQAPWYRRWAVEWVAGGKQEKTREARLGRLLAASAAGRRL
ncbi:MAG TPA: YdeI/OmpD-associated family protein [Opitutaceae bacterium]|nr:YdeI/OmpD-associated family protein [Opitutaceae bacterium]